MLIGRKKERELLSNALNDTESHFIAVYGRRRIGKTFLIKETFNNRFAFQCSGINNGTLREELDNFRNSLVEKGLRVPKKFKDWLEAFESLKQLISKSTEQRKIIFLDELSWMDTRKSNFVKSLESFWNGWASFRDDIILIVCASSTSWMLSKIIHNKGGLYNRLSEQMHLGQFSLLECEELIKSRNIILTRMEIAKAYMIFGGVPYYWCQLHKGEGLSLNIDRLFFQKDAPLKNEFDYLYRSLFNYPEKYLKIIDALANKNSLTRNEIAKATDLESSGDLTTKLDELESCGFIQKYNLFGLKKRDSVYKLVDFFTIFYYKIVKNCFNDEHFFSLQINTPSINTWNGLSFERLCMSHIAQIKAKLGISGVLSNVNSWSCKRNDEQGLHGSQIDCLIVRKDMVINLCEMKFSSNEYVLSKQEFNSIQTKISDLMHSTGTKSAIYPTIVTTFGLIDNEYSRSIQSVICLNDLFAF